MHVENLAHCAHDIFDIAVKAGEAILPFYRHEKDLKIEYKSDHSPLTAADQAAHRVITQCLTNYLGLGIPILSEESESISLPEKLKWQQYWCVDPLDGTKEFVKGDTEFTVNIALIDKGKPILGVIYAPVLKIGYFAWKQGGAFRKEGDEILPIHTTNPLCQPLRVVASRYHGLAKLTKLLNEFPEHIRLTKGSALKFCEVAEGNADLFLRATPTGEWDNAAGQCIVEEAGGVVMHLDFSSVLYNQKPTLKTQPLLVVGDPTYAWKKCLESNRLND